MNRISRTSGTALATAALCLALLSGCGGSANGAPQNLAFDEATGSFSFDAVEGADTYTVGVSKVLNETTGKALESINGSATIDLEGGSEYLWSEQTGSVSGLADSDGDGVVDGTVVFREYSSSASTVGDVISMDQLPLGHYVVQAVPSSTEELPNPEAAVLEFTKGGTLAAPEGFTAQVNADGHMEITAPSDYYLSCLTKTGLPTEMKFEVKEGDSVVDTITMDDFSYTNTVNGPNKMFTFNNQTVTGTAALEAGKDYSVTVTAVGDGDQIKDATAEAYMATSTEPAAFASTYDTKGTASTESGISLAVTLGTDASGVPTYELTATANDMVLFRESGSFEASAEAGTYDEKNTFPADATLTFATTASDLETPVLDGVTLSVEASEARGGFGAPGGASAGKNYTLKGSATFEGQGVEFGQSQGGFPGGPM